MWPMRACWCRQSPRGLNRSCGAGCLYICCAGGRVSRKSRKCENFPALFLINCWFSTIKYSNNVYACTKNKTFWRLKNTTVYGKIETSINIGNTVNILSISCSEIGDILWYSFDCNVNMELVDFMSLPALAGGEKSVSPTDVKSSRGRESYE